MRIFFTTTMFLLVLSNISYSAVINVSAFGAKGDGKSNNTAAFIRLSQWIANNPGSTIVFGKGTYLAGEQVFRKNSQYGSWSVSSIIDLSNTRNITLEGNGATICYKAGSKFGTFDQVTQRPMKVILPYNDRRNMASLGEVLMIKDASGIIVNNLNFDGNIDKMEIGGGFGDVGWQVPHRGIYIINSTNISIKKCVISNFGLDAISIENAQNSAKSDNIVIDQIVAKRNGRQGISWVGGRGVTISNCELSATGRGRLASNPCAGLSLESEAGLIVQDGTIINCRFIENTNCGMVCDSGPLVKNMTFTNCLFENGDTYTVHANGQNLKFINCTFKGALIPGGKDPATNVLFDKCTFIDYQLASNKDGRPSRFLIEGGGGAINYTIRQSKFYLYKRKLAFIEPATLAMQHMPVLTENTIYIFSKQQKQTEYIAILKRTVFTYNTVIDSTDLKPGNYYYFQFENNSQMKGNLLVPKPAGTVRWRLNEAASGRSIKL